MNDEELIELHALEVTRRQKLCVDACEGIPDYQLIAENGAPNRLGDVIDALRNKQPEILDTKPEAWISTCTITGKEFIARQQKQSIQPGAYKYTELFLHQGVDEYERGKSDGWEACETCHGIVDGGLPSKPVGDTYFEPKTCPEAYLQQEIAKLRKQPDADLVKLIKDDAYAMTFQSMGQYRSALIKAVGGK